MICRLKPSKIFVCDVIDVSRKELSIKWLNEDGRNIFASFRPVTKNRDRKVLSETADPRLPDLGWRALAGGDVVTDATEADYDAHRIARGIPEGGLDFAFGDAFPHDVDMDQLHGVAFTKGCYVGQEVVSRMEHRHTARRRVVVARAADRLPANSEVLAAGRPIGTLGSSAGELALALVRLDRAKDAMDRGEPLTAAGVPLSLSIPEWARFSWPTPAEAREG